MFRGRADLQAGLPVQKTGARSHLSQVEKSWSTVFLGAVCLLEKVELLSVIRCMGIPQMLLIAFHLILHMPPFNDTKYLITPNITGIITHLCF